VIASMGRLATHAAVLAALCSGVSAGPVRTSDGLAAQADAVALTNISIGNLRLPGVFVEGLLIDPRTKDPAKGFSITGQWTAAEQCLRLEGEVRAPGDKDTVVDLVIRVRGASVPQSGIDRDPLLLPAELLSKLPLVSLRLGGEDRLALAVPPDRPSVCRFADTHDGAELRFPFGFTKDARPELRMRAPFACVLYRTEPRWRFRSALERYYALFPEPFKPFVRKGGAWLFAATSKDLPDPQHFHYHQGGPADCKDDDERGLGTYPYQESCCRTVTLPGKEQPKTYDEAMDRFAELEQQQPDLKYVRDNAVQNTRGEYVLSITDDLSADAKPDPSLNVLRFTLNVDPNLPDSPAKPNAAGRQFEFFDRVFRETPSVDGCYFDSVSVWCYGVLNCRREQWSANRRPFGYHGATFGVGAHGRFAMSAFLRALQERYHPQGKAVFTNMHANLDAFPLYLVSDIAGIEGSAFENLDATFFYRASACKKPVLLMNFIHPHGLDKRGVVEQFYYNAALWGELPSTGRSVQEAYRLHGDLAHTWMPAIRELAEAGWEPVPLASGAHVERFPARDAVCFTIRSPGDGATPLRIDRNALKDLEGGLLAMDAVTLKPMELRVHGDDFALELPRLHKPVTVVRIASRAEIQRWLLVRAVNHVAAAARVRGDASKTPEVLAVAAALRTGAQAGPGALANSLSETLSAVATAIQRASEDDKDLFALSTRRELQQAHNALVAIAQVPN